MNSDADQFTLADRERLLAVLRERKPKSAWLFGSRAKGTAGPESDVDLLIVDDRTGGRGGIELEISVDLFPRYWHLDILAYTPASIENERRNPDSFVSRIMEGAVLLYEQN